MRLAIMSDLHLGKRMYRNEDSYLNRFEQAGYDVFDSYIENIAQSDADIVINCGDTFDVPNPTIIATSKYINEMQKLQNKTVLTVSGNHDFSFANRQYGYNSILCADASNMINATYDIVTYEKDGVLFVLMPYVYDTDDNILQRWTTCERLIANSKLKKVLVTHGVTEHYANMFPELKDKYVIPDDLVEKFDVVLIGHIHNPFTYYSHNTLVISPGASIDYQADECHTGPMYLDLDTMEIERNVLDTPHIISIDADDTNINDYLSSVTRAIYKINYAGNNIDENLYLEARRRAINLSIQRATVDDLSSTSTTTEISLYDWLQANYPDDVEAIRKIQLEVDV